MARGKDGGGLMARPPCPDCDGTGTVEVCKRCGPAVHVCDEVDYVGAYPDAWGVWRRRCEICEGTGLLDDEQEKAA